MLTVKQPPSYGYKSVHDLPTPPSTSRLSPPLIYQEPATKSLPVAYRGHTSPSQPMSAPHRGLPPPAAMALPPQQPTTVGVPPPPPPHHQPLPPQPLPQQPQQQPSLGPLVHQQRDRGQLPAPPQQWQGAEESMKLWLQARTEEDRTRQEEERTRQESLRLEQRRVEMDMLRTSIQAGIPPPMVPLVFAGMGAGGLPPHTALEWAQQFMPPGQVLPHAQTTSAQWPLPPEHQRESQSQPHTQQQGIPSASTQAAGYAYPPSPSRPRGQTATSTYPTFRSSHMPMQCIRICSKLNNSMNHKRVRRYTFIIGNRLTRRLVVARIDPEVLLGKLPESAKPPGMPFPQHAANNSIDHHHPLTKAARRMRHIVGQVRATLGNGVTCRHSELLGQGVLEGRVSAGLCAEGRQYEDHRYEGHQSQHLCRSKNDQATNTAILDNQYQQFSQKSLSPPGNILGLLARATRAGLNTDNVPRTI
ncbi:hypothetical protein FAUST_4346 [Fusarium austroamericanum]|uniref:Uncharacterized protein n=1 Tax=Fusarium austroamericanum TaxID=282268 RepID=A0AAN6C345_FUSAU|nr:hypothetical protein FAUST_4346 [Fusarium austroamericanum]